MEPRRILIVDNDPAAAAVTSYGLSEALGTSAYIHVASSVNAASAACRNGEVDLLIIDPSTRDPAAWALIEEVCHKYPTIQVLLFTAYGNNGVARRAKGIGVKYYLTKPLDLPELQQAVVAMLSIPMLS